MDWPHDPDGDEGSEGRRKYGHAVLAKKIDEDEDFPLFHTAVGVALREAGYWPYRLDHA